MVKAVPRGLTSVADAYLTPLIKTYLQVLQDIDTIIVFGVMTLLLYRICTIAHTKRRWQLLTLPQSFRAGFDDGLSNVDVLFMQVRLVFTRANVHIISCMLFFHCRTI